jgi:hypothetical protein
VPEYSSRQVEVLVTDMTYHTGEDHSLRYDEIYKIFNTGDFPPEDEDLEAYQNIQKERNSPGSCMTCIIPLQ